MERQIISKRSGFSFKTEPALSERTMKGLIQVSISDMIILKVKSISVPLEELHPIMEKRLRGIIPYLHQKGNELSIASSSGAF